MDDPRDKYLAGTTWDELSRLLFMKRLSRFTLLMLCLSFQPDLQARDYEDTCKYFIPNALTPDCDGVGCEILEIVSSCTFCEFSFTIYDRFGSVHFESKDPELKFDCTDSPEGTYLWKLDAEFCNSPRMNDSGTLTVLK